jgi:hypothetical protein
MHPFGTMRIIMAFEESPLLSDSSVAVCKALFLKSGDNIHPAWLKHLAESTVSPLLRKTALPPARGWKRSVGSEVLLRSQAEAIRPGRFGKIHNLYGFI